MLFHLLVLSVYFGIGASRALRNNLIGALKGHDTGHLSVSHLPKNLPVESHIIVCINFINSL